MYIEERAGPRRARTERENNRDETMCCSLTGVFC